MILATAAPIFIAGLVCWLAGIAMDQPEIAVIGGVLIVGVGAAIMTDGLEYRDGRIEEVDGSTTTVEPQYSTVPLPQNLPLGVLVTLLGGIMTITSINRFGDY